MKKETGAKLFLSAGLALMVLFAAGCKRDESQKVVIKAGTATVTLGQYRDALKKLLPQGDNGGEDVSELKKDLLNQLMEEALILREADKAGIKVSEEEIASKAEGMKKEYGEEAFKTAINERYGGMEKWREEIRNKLMVRKMVGKIEASRPAPTIDDARRYYQEHVDEYAVDEQVHARMIVAATEDDASKIKARVNPGNFADVAKESSLSPEGKSGGDLGFFSRGEMPSEFEEVVFKLKPGEISRVVKTEYGYHIFFLEEKRKAQKLKFEDVKDRIAEKLRIEDADEAVTSWISGLKKNEKIEINEGLL